MTTSHPGPSGSSRPAGTNLTGLRDHNAALALGLLRAAPQGSSRVELATGTGLTPQAIGKITARLLVDGMIVEAGQAASTGGKPRTLLRLRAEAACAVGVHLERDELTVLLVDLAGHHHLVHTQPVELGITPADAVRLIVEQVDRVAAARPVGARLLGVGVGCRGPLDHTAGILHWFTPPGARGSGWDRYPLRDELAARLHGLPVVVDKDTNTAALAEAPTDPGPGSGLAYVHLAAGLGAGLLLDGALHRGTRTNAGEFGHQTVRIDGPLCDCGNRGCLEVLCLAELRRGDHAAAADLVGVGVANLVRLLDIDRVVLGGRVVLADPDTYLAGVTAQIAARIPDTDWQPVPVSVSTAGRLAVAAGAAELVLGPLFGRRT
ncbi:ROK family protein [Kitasatospora sp. NPDC059327]|uniref:ROK family protein n=1 Tax=Kitasatospora sp. NPDC059327 TaxID=3346803 RepID=UPI0036A78D4C